MEVTINLRISADEALTSLIRGLTGAKPTTATASLAAEAPAPKQKKQPAVDVSIEELRELAQKLMSKDKAKLKTLLEKYGAKTITNVKAEDFVAFKADLQEAV